MYAIRIHVNQIHSKLGSRHWIISCSKWNLRIKWWWEGKSTKFTLWSVASRGGEKKRQAWKKEGKKKSFPRLRLVRGKEICLATMREGEKKIIENA